MKKRIKDHAVGVIVYHEFPRSRKYLLLKHRKGHWSFAKGHSDQGETEYMTARRELHEEAGLDDVEFLSDKVLLKEKYEFVSGKGAKVKKEVSYFVAMAKSDHVKVDNMEILRHKWCTLYGSEKVLTYKQSYKILRQADRLIQRNKTK